VSNVPPDQSGAFGQWLAALIALYFTAESRLLGGVAGILRFTTPDVLGQLTALRKIRRLVEKVNLQLTAGDQYVGPLVESAAEAGAASGSKEIARVSTALERVPAPFDFSIPHGERSVQAIRDDIVSTLQDVRRRITRLPDDVYKVISPAAAAGQALGHGYTPAQAQAFAWREYVRQGVTGFTDRSGRNWSLSAYVEMSVRSETMRAYNASHLQVLTAAGIHLFTVSDDGHPCPLCQPWQNRVLTQTPDGEHATIAEATAAGLFHPNCKHVLSGVIPGVTQLPAVKPWADDDQRLYNLTQQQRRLELEIRKAKRTLEYASNPAAASKARQDVRHAQARMRKFITDTGFLRYSRREQVDLANDHLKLPR